MSDNPILADYFDTDQLAEVLGVTSRTIVRWRLGKQGPPLTYLGRRILYRKEGVKAWLGAQERQASRFSKRDSSWKAATA